MRLPCVLTIVMLLSPGLYADLVLEASLLGSPLTVVNFSQYSGDFLFTAGPEQVGSLVGEDIIFTASSSDAVLGDGGGLPDNEYGFVFNGLWGNGLNGFAGTNGTTMVFHFNTGPVSGVGGFMNYVIDPATQAPLDDVSILALGADNTVLESYVISNEAPIVTGNGLNLGAFRGISRAANDIYAFQLQGSFAAIDDLTFSRISAVPEPSALLLTSLAAIGVLALRRPSGCKR